MLSLLTIIYMYMHGVIIVADITTSPTYVCMYVILNSKPVCYTLISWLFVFSRLIWCAGCWCHSFSWYGMYHSTVYTGIWSSSDELCEPQLSQLTGAIGTSRCLEVAASTCTSLWLMLMQWTPSTVNCDQLSHWITYWSLLLTTILPLSLQCHQGQPTSQQGHHQVCMYWCLCLYNTYMTGPPTNGVPVNMLPIIVGAAGTNWAHHVMFVVITIIDAYFDQFANRRRRSDINCDYLGDHHHYCCCSQETQRCVIISLFVLLPPLLSLNNHKR